MRRTATISRDHLAETNPRLETLADDIGKPLIDGDVDRHIRVPVDHLLQDTGERQRQGEPRSVEPQDTAPPPFRGPQAFDFISDIGKRRRSGSGIIR
ncbi:hypothetical protein [Afifella aestuarii]|uniref:hypothetical protein n=1 Tax=Afifella aestuarii TaxID=1909496 RepID=UPI001FE92E3A|nr:hypothetical protein [Afifella aestuarii]